MVIVVDFEAEVEVGDCGRIIMNNEWHQYAIGAQNLLLWKSSDQHLVI